MAQLPDTRRLLDLLYSNEVPRPQEDAPLRQKVEEMATAVETARYQLSILKRQKRLYDIITSPQRRVPLEILSNIFELVLPPTLFEDGRDQLISLCLVCKRWRDAARQSCRLWKSIGIIFTGKPLQHERILAWLARSCDQTKAVFMVIDGHREFPNPFPSAKLASLLAILPPLEKLYLQLSYGLEWYKMLEDTMCATANGRSGEWPSDMSVWETLPVKSLGIDDRGMGLVFTYPGQCLVKRLPLSVESLELYTSVTSNIIHPSHLSRLTKLVLHSDADGILLENLLISLKPCLALVELDLDVDRLSSSDSVAEQAYTVTINKLVAAKGISLPHLQKLRLSLSLRVAPLGLLQVFQAPNVSLLHICFWASGIKRHILRHKYACEFAKLRAFVNEHPSLRSLTVANAYVEGEKSWDDLFTQSGFPHIQHLELSLIDAHGGSLLGLLKKCPSLESLELLNCQLETFDLTKELRRVRQFLQKGDDGPVATGLALKRLKVTYPTHTQTVLGLLPLQMRDHESALWKEVRLLHELGIDCSIGPKAERIPADE